MLRSAEVIALAAAASVRRNFHNRQATYRHSSEISTLKPTTTITIVYAFCSVTSKLALEPTQVEKAIATLYTMSV